MQEAAPSVPCTASRIAPAAREWLSITSPSRPYHIFERVANLINAEGDVLTLMLTPAEMNPLALEINCQNHTLDLTRTIETSSDFEITSHKLVVGDLRIDLEPAASWNPSPDWPLVQVHRDELREMCELIQRQLLSNPSSESLAIFVSPGVLESLVNGWQERARVPIQELLHRLRAGDHAGSGDCAASLAGLGMGLTPGGDDFIIGVMHAIWSIIVDKKASSICRALADAAEQKTNRLSACSLRRAAMGETSAAWQALLQGMALTDQETISHQTKTLMQLGHTSGQDALAGFLLAVSALHPH
jgi:hypothetical protein